MSERFSPVSKLFHWLMALLILAMLFIGIAMVSTLTPTYSKLVAIHKPLGIAILILALLRIANRLRTPPPALPPSLPPVLALAAKASHILLYTLMVAMPLIGWGMLSASRYPIAMLGGLYLPPILPQSDSLYAALRMLHTDLALLLFATVLAHIGAALFHGLIRRDGVFGSMAGKG